MTNTDILSAFLDNEPFDAGALADALSNPDGRQTLVELIGLRHVVQTAIEMPPAVNRRRSPGRTRWLYAAAILLAAGIGYAAGHVDRGPRQLVTTNAESAPPAPAVVMHAAANAQWEPVRIGG